jgi:Chaperone of endosialidase
MKKLYFLSSVVLCILNFSFAQNVGIGNRTPTEKLHVDSGSIKIGKATWNGSNIPFLKFGDFNYVTLGEEEADDKLTLRAKELFIRPSAPYPGIPVSIQGSQNYSHFYFGTNEDTYIRGGKASSNLILGDGGGRTGINVYPQRAMLEQNGSVGATSAIFGGDGSGISLQKNWPAIGFNSYLDGAGHKSINLGYGAQMGLNQTTGSLYLVSFPFNANANTTFSSFTQNFYISRYGKISLGVDVPNADLSADLHIKSRNFTYSNEGADMGITFENNFDYENGFLSNSKWNIHNGSGTSGPFLSGAFLNFWSNRDNAGWQASAGIDSYDGAYYQISDMQLKKQINTLKNENMLGKIKMINPVSYLMKNEQENHPLRYGFLAQEVEKIFSGLVVSTSKNKLMNYTSFIPILTKGIQEQQQQIEDLQKQNKELNARLEKLEKIILKQ